MDDYENRASKKQQRGSNRISPKKIPLLDVNWIPGKVSK
jgi:hypothetical protein